LSGARAADVIPEGLAEPARSTREFWSDERQSTAEAGGVSRPVFVLGSVRSGTSAMCLALQRGTRYRGFPEGHVLDIAIRLFGALGAHYDMKDRWIPRAVSGRFQMGRVGYAHFHRELIDLLTRAAAGYTTPYWFDKTPTYQMVASVPLLAQAWPEARFLFMKRRGLENMASRARKFRGGDFRGACRDWALIMSAWRAVRDTVTDRFLDVDQLDMLTNPKGTAADVGRLLGLPPPEVEALAALIGRERPELTDPTASIVDKPSDLGWTPEQISVFQEVCGTEMEAYGYTYDARYRL
jgi:hypothetical protein